MKKSIKLIALGVCLLIVTSALSVSAAIIFGAAVCMGVNYLINLPLDLLFIYYVTKKCNSSKS